MNNITLYYNINNLYPTYIICTVKNHYVLQKMCKNLHLPLYFSRWFYLKIFINKWAWLWECFLLFIFHFFYYFYFLHFYADIFLCLFCLFYITFICKAAFQLYSQSWIAIEIDLSLYTQKDILKWTSLIVMYMYIWLNISVVHMYVGGYRGDIDH